MGLTPPSNGHDIDLCKGHQSMDITQLLIQDPVYLNNQCDYLGKGRERRRGEEKEGERVMMEKGDEGREGGEGERKERD